MNSVIISKKLINDVDNCVDESLRGVACLYPSLLLHLEHRFISTRQRVESSNVAVLSGGGSGHEPFSSGYVGWGMLSGAVAGSVFASPPKGNILYGIEHLHRYYKGGILVIIPNYTGDRLNFGMAVEKAKNMGLKVESIVVGEDCASDNASAIGRRGMCGLVLLYKLSGALARQGQSMDILISTIRNIVKNLSTLGVTLRPCSLPGQPPLFHIADDEMELGAGVHGEAGIETLKLGTAKQAVSIVLGKLCDHLKLKIGSRLAVMVNNLGATSQIEENIISAEVHDQLVKKGMKVERMYAGLVMTSLDMAGFQVSVLNIPPDNDDWLELLDAETHAPKWVGSKSSVKPNQNVADDIFENISEKDKEIKTGVKLEDVQQLMLKECLEDVARELRQCEKRLNELDGGCGDGDCGTTLRCLADGIMNNLSSLDLQSPANVFLKLADISENLMGGTSGALYNIGFTAAAEVFTREIDSAVHISDLWCHSLSNATNAIMKYGGAKPGDRTMIDALVPPEQTLRKASPSDIGTTLNKAVEAAEIGCESTRNMKARAGRASYVSENRITDVDAGAYAVFRCFDAIRGRVNRYVL